VHVPTLTRTRLVVAMCFVLANTPLHAERPALPPLRQATATPPGSSERTQKEFVLFFEFRSSALTPRGRAIVKDAVTAAIGDKVTKVAVIGHSDTVGSFDYNQALSQRRAEAVKVEIIRDGFNGEIITIGKSFSSPLVETGLGITEPQNRRAAIEFEQ
jgi:OmpA-OmpF porin, OOP family